MTKNFSIVTMVICMISCWAVSFAQGNVKTNGNAWMSEIRNYKHNFLVNEVGLSNSQKSDFLPLYTAMENEIYQVNYEARELENEITKSKTAVSDIEYEQAANVLSSVKAKEAEIEGRYFLKFSHILSKKQLFLLKRAENRFTKTMLVHNKQSRNQQKK